MTTNEAETGKQAPTAIAAARTMLFVPGNRPDRFGKAVAAGADAIVLDLEDAVAPADKTAARQAIRQWRDQGGPGLVRVNGRHTPWYLDDVASLNGPSVVLLPKTAGPGDVADLRSRLAPGSWIIAILETAQAILNATAIAAAPGVARLAFGNGDLAAELGVAHTSHAALATARSSVVLASAAAGIAPPLDGVTTALADDAALTADAQHAREMGFTGRLCIHPHQIATTRRALAPRPDDVQWAQAVLAAAGDSVAVVNGDMIDQPILKRAQRLLADSSRAPAAALDPPG